ncbi:hypothetical protein M0J92_RS21180 [Escherichia coli]|nr:hypothetical protein [Escherichia coli]EJD7275397.1 hypothetical protein [Escherichia coli]
MQKQEPESLMVAMKKSALSVAKILAGVLAGVVVISGVFTGINALHALLKTLYGQHADGVRYTVCGAGWFFLVFSNWLWMTYSRYTRRNGREPSGAAGVCLLVMMSLCVLAEFCTGLVLVWLCLQPATASILPSVAMLMSITALIIAVSLGLKFGR